jgi:long-chain acyl-CoA synthetase
MNMQQHVWEKSYPPGLSWGEPLPEATPLEDYLFAAADKWPDRPAIDFYGRIVTFREMCDLARRAACGFQSLGVGPGINVGLYLPNTPHYSICFFGAMMAGAAVVNFGPLSGPRELKYQINDADVRLMVSIDMPMFYPAVAALMGEGQLETLVTCSLVDFLDSSVVAAMKVPRTKPVSTPGRQIAFSDFVANDGGFIAPKRARLEDEVAVLQYTGGTTGTPKGATLTHGNFFALLKLSARVGAALSSGVPPTQRSSPKRLVVMPLSHIGGLGFGVLQQQLSGTEVVLHIGFDAGRVLADIEEKGITEFAAVPAMFAALVKHPRFNECDLSSLQFWGFSGAFMPRDVASRFFERAGTSTQQVYGLTETTGSATFQFAASTSPSTTTVGLPMPLTTLEIVDVESGMTILPAGQAGEICLTGPQIMKGYWNNPAATEQAFRGGRFHTGDLGVMDLNGYVTLLDRKKDMILTGGFNVYPSRIEEAILEHSAVAEVAVVGVDNPQFGQIAKAFVVLNTGCSALTHVELLDFLADKLSRYEMPLEMELRASLPKTPIGKPSKRDLMMSGRGQGRPVAV